MSGQKKVVLYDEEDEKTLRTRITIIIIILAIITSITGLSLIIIDKLTPLPTKDACTALGYEVGVNEGNKIICYDKCTNNKISSCGERRVLI